MSTTLFPQFPLLNDHSYSITKEKLSMKIRKNIICRLCLQKHEKLYNIFDEEDEQDTNEISRYIEIFFAVSITKADPYSTFVCKPCWDWIITLCKYRLQFRKNDALLKSRKGNIISEITEPETSSDVSDCHYSVRNILLQGIYLNIKYWKINFDVKVNLSDCRVPDQITTPTPQCNENEDESVLRSGKVLKIHPVHKRRLSDYHQYNCFSDDNEESIALNREKRQHKRTKIYGDPFSLSDEGADDSDSDPVFSILKKYTRESSINPEILTAINMSRHLTASTGVHFHTHNRSPQPYLCPKRLSAQKARENLVKWLNPKNSTIQILDKTDFPTSEYQFQDPEQKEEIFTTIQCKEKTWNRFANAQFKKILSNNKLSKKYP